MAWVMRKCLSRNPWWLNGMLSCWVLSWVTALVPVSMAHLPLFSSLFECKPQEVKVTICLNTHSKAFSLYGHRGWIQKLPSLVVTTFFCSFVNILSELCPRQISLGQTLERMGFQEGHRTQERAYWLVSIWTSLCGSSLFIFMHNSPYEW